MASVTAPRRYARALFSIASEDGSVAAVRAELRGLGALLEASPELRDVLLQPLHSAAERRRVLEGVAEKLGASSLLRRFYSYLIDQRRLVAFDQIEAEFVRLADEAAGKKKARVKSAQPLSADQQARLARALSARAGTTVELEVEVDPALVGGLVAQIGDTVYDGSLRTQLTQLRSTLLGS
ncbi:MAG: ATP synthase F1 subunit delta [Deltaproteobacteria bacterium]|nr:ATP synthase F1 subunit delta [Deltaproteobacteria bacterium]